MCGIVGFVGREPRPVASLVAALDALRHRGPDENGFWQSVDQRVGLGSTRLAIIGPDNGRQPIQNEDGEISAVVNGELYDFERIREHLRERGHKFRTDSDAEIAIHLYEEHGEGFVEHLRGEFAIILWDNKAQKLVAVRDRFGIKPLCYAVTPSGIYLGSEAKALFALGVTPAWDEESIYHVANTQYVLPDRTLFAGVNQLRPGHILTFDHSGVSTRTYWDLDYGIADDDEAPAEVGPEMIERFASAFQEAVKLRLRSDVPVCFHLSGGLDSSAVLGTAARMTSAPLTAFSVCFEESSYDEQALAQEMAELVGASFHPIQVSDKDLMDCLPDAVYHSEGLAVNGHLPAKYLLNREIRKAGFKVALTGEGSDELLCGYAHFRTDLFRHTNREALVSALFESNTASQGIMLSHGQSLPLTAVSDKLQFVPAFLEAKGSLGHKMCSILSPQFVSRFEKEDCYKRLLESFDLEGQVFRRPRVHQSLYLWTKTALANYILRTLGDGCEMAHSVEGRLPFLDHRLFELVRTLPLSAKIHDTTEKYILREAMKGVITENIRTREKHPFVAPPICRFSRKYAQDLVRDSINSQSFSSVPFFDRAKVTKFMDEMDTIDEADRAARDPIVMMVLSIAALHERFKM